MFNNNPCSDHVSKNTPDMGGSTPHRPTQQHPVRGVFTGIPSRTAALIHDVQRGGARSYLDVGRQLGEHLCANVPYDLDSTDEWLDILHRDVVQVIKSLPGGDTWRGDMHLSPLRDWLNNHFPGITMRIPPRHHLKFTEGFVKGVVFSGNWLF